MNKLLTVLVCALFAANASGQSEQVLRPVLSAYTFEAGTAHAADTYLSPLHYSGWHAGVGYERMQAMAFNPDDWIMQLGLRGIVDRMANPARNAHMWNFEVDGRWCMMRRFRDVFTPGLTLAIGPGTELRGGALWLSRNGNNPASAKGAWTVDLAVMGSYNIHIGKLPVTFRYECALPVAGVFFAPEYGELYYELWLGNHSGVVHTAWWGDYFRIDNYVTADLRFGGTTLRVGYRNDVTSTKSDDVVSRRITHTFTLGVATEWLSLSARKNTLDRDARIISALY